MVVHIIGTITKALPMLRLTLSLTAAMSQAINHVISRRFFSDLTAYEMGLMRKRAESGFWVENT